MVETQLCKLRGTSDTFVGRAYSIFHFLKTRNPAAPKAHPLEKAFLNPMDPPAARMKTKSAVSDMPTISPTEHPRTSPPGSRVSEHMPLYISCVCLPECSVSQAMATSALEAWKITWSSKARGWMRPAWAHVSYFADQLLITDDAIFFRWEHNNVQDSYVVTQQQQ